MSEEALGFQPIGHLPVIGKFFPVVVGQSVHIGSIWCHGFDDCSAHRGGDFVFRFDNHAEPALTLSERDQHGSALSANDRIDFPIPNAASAFNNLWTFRDTDPPDDLSAALGRTAALTP